MKYNLLEIIGVIASLLAIIIIIVVAYNKFSKKTLLYQVKQYKIQEDTYINILCLWNPTYTDIVDTDISQQLTLGTFYDPINSFLINTTDGNLSNMIRIINIKEKYLKRREIQIKFKKFPARSGAIFLIKSSTEIRKIDGKIKGNELEKFTTKGDFYYFLNLIVFMLAFTISSFVVRENLLFSVSAAFILFLFIRLIIEIIEMLHNDYKDKPKVLRQYWKGNSYD